MSIFNKKKIIVTHNGTFHADDLFAVATLAIVFNDDVKIIRTRDPEIIASADVVCDVGGIYDANKDRFDHHQKGGAGARPNGIPYSSFGLVWEKYGEQICGLKEVASKVDEKLVQSVDANDNGINLYEVKENVAPYTIQDALFSFRPSWKEKQDYDSSFFNAIPFVKNIIFREIVRTRDDMEAESIIKEAYNKAEDKRVIIFDTHYPWRDTIDKYSEPLYVITKKDNMWRAESVQKQKYNFELRKPFPEVWAGKRDEDMAEVSGVSDATFCHNGRFLVVAKSKEGIMELVKKALIA
jgi:uncharacterized UPF0160 family protein